MSDRLHHSRGLEEERLALFRRVRDARTILRVAQKARRFPKRSINAGTKRPALRSPNLRFFSDASSERCSKCLRWIDTDIPISLTVPRIAMKP